MLSANIFLHIFLFLLSLTQYSRHTQIQAWSSTVSRVPGESVRYEFIPNASNPNVTRIKDSLPSNLLGDLVISEISNDVYWQDDALGHKGGLTFSGNQKGSPVYSEGTFGAFHDSVYNSSSFASHLWGFGMTFEFWVRFKNTSNPTGRSVFYEAGPIRNGSALYCPNQTALFSMISGLMITKDITNITYNVTCSETYDTRDWTWVAGQILHFLVRYTIQDPIAYICAFDNGGILGGCSWFDQFREISSQGHIVAWHGNYVTSNETEWNNSHLLICPQGNEVQGAFIQAWSGIKGVDTLNATVLMFAFYPFPLDDGQAIQNWQAWIWNSPPFIISNLSLVALEDIPLNIYWADMFTDVDVPDVLYVHFINLPQNGTLFILLPGGSTTWSSMSLVPVALTLAMTESNDTINYNSSGYNNNTNNGDNTQGNVTLLLENSNGFDWINTNFAPYFQYQTLQNYPLFPQNEIIWYNLTDGTDFRIGYLNITSLPQPDPPVATSETLSVGVVRGTQQKFKVNYTDVDYVNGVIPPSTLGFSVTILTLPRFGVLRQWDNSLIGLNSLLTDPLQPPHTIQYYANLINSPPLNTEGTAIVAMDSFTFSVHDSRTGNTSNIGTVTIDVLNHLNLASTTVLTCHQDDNPCFLRLPFGIPATLFSSMLTATYVVTLTSLPSSTQASLASIDVDATSGITTFTDVASVPTDIALNVPNSNPNATTDYLTIAFTPKLHWFGNTSFTYHVSQVYNGSNFRSIDTTALVQVLRINHPANITLTKPVLHTSQNLTVYAPAAGLPAANASISATFAMTDIDANATNYTVILTSNVDGNEGAIKFAIDPVNVPNLFFISPTSAKNTSVFAVTITGSYFQIQAALVNVSISGGFTGTGIMKAIVIDDNNYFVSPGFYQTVLVVPFTVVPYTVTITAAISTAVFYTLIGIAVACCCGCCWCCSHQYSEWLQELERRKRKTYEVLQSAEQ